MATAPPTQKEAGPAATTQRYLALDAFRGFIMILLVSGGFGFSALRNHPIFGILANQLDHVPWEGSAFWDMVQPAFMFMVGVAMPFAMARRDARGATFGQNLRHVAWRSLKLIILSEILSNSGGRHFQFQLINVLCQIAFTYFFCFLIMQLKWRWQAVASVLILAGYWALFAIFPGPAGPFSEIGNIGAVIDRAVLGKNYPGGYVTINFISATVTTLFGVWTGMLLRTSRDRVQKLKILALAAAGSLAGGLALWSVCPLIKRLWTPSFTLYSTGWVMTMMLVFWWLIEFRGYRKLAFPFMVVGMNSIFVYCIFQAFEGTVRHTIGAFTNNFVWVGTLAPVALSCSTLLAIWYACYWCYQRKIFFKL